MSHRPENDSAEARISEFGRAYAAALLAGDEVAAEIVIREAMDAKLSMAEIDDEIIAPALWRRRGPGTASCSRRRPASCTSSPCG